MTKFKPRWTLKIQHKDPSLSGDTFYVTDNTWQTLTPNSPPYQSLFGFGATTKLNQNTI